MKRYLPASSSTARRRDARASALTRTPARANKASASRCILPFAIAIVNILIHLYPLALISPPPRFEEAFGQVVAPDGGGRVRAVLRLEVAAGEDVRERV